MGLPLKIPTDYETCLSLSQPLLKLDRHIHTHLTMGPSYSLQLALPELPPPYFGPHSAVPGAPPQHLQMVVVPPLEEVRTDLVHWTFCVRLVPESCGSWKIVVGSYAEPDHCVDPTHVRADWFTLSSTRQDHDALYQTTMNFEGKATNLVLLWTAKGLWSWDTPMATEPRILLCRTVKAPRSWDTLEATEPYSRSWDTLDASEPCILLAAKTCNTLSHRIAEKTHSPIDSRRRSATPRHLRPT